MRVIMWLSGACSLLFILAVASFCQMATQAVS